MGDITVIILYLLQRMDGNWGYKEIFEKEGPCYYKCPISFLDKAKPQNNEWRAKVIEAHKQNNNRTKSLVKIKVNSVVTLRDSIPNKFSVVSVKPLLGSSLDPDKPGLFKLVKTRIVSVEEK
jgi:hypothetical protein